MLDPPKNQSIRGICWRRVQEKVDLQRRLGMCNIQFAVAEDAIRNYEGFPCEYYETWWPHSELKWIEVAFVFVGGGLSL